MGKNGIPSIVFAVFCCILSAYVVSGAPVHEAESNQALARTTLEEYLSQCWKNFVASMSTGIPDMNIPTFDPWIGNGDFPFQVQESSIALRLEANATYVQSLGFSSVQIPVFVEDPVSASHNISLMLPDLNIQGTYYAMGTHHYFYPIIGSGQFDIILRDIRSNGTTNVLVNDNVISLTLVNLQPLMYGSAASSYSGLSVSGVIGSDANYQLIVNSLTEMLWQQVEVQLRQQLSVSVTDYLNAQLVGFQPSGDLRKKMILKEISKVLV